MRGSPLPGGLQRGEQAGLHEASMERSRRLVRLVFLEIAMKTRVQHDPAERASEAPTKIQIETSEDYALALKRIKALNRSQRAQSDEAELEALNQAVRSWDNRHVAG
jgi:hypothetical protein